MRKAEGEKEKRKRERERQKSVCVTRASEEMGCGEEGFSRQVFVLMWRSTVNTRIQVPFVGYPSLRGQHAPKQEGP